jgi:hypothetical protein
MKSQSTRRTRLRLIGLSVLGCAALGLVAADSLASRSFTLAMEPTQKAHWEKQFNGLLSEPFAKVACESGKRIDLPVGQGCVEAADVDICCVNWTLKVKCNDEHRWENTSVEGASCTKKPHKKDDAKPGAHGGR